MFDVEPMTVNGAMIREFQGPLGNRKAGAAVLADAV